MYRLHNFFKNLDRYNNGKFQNDGVGWLSLSASDTVKKKESQLPIQNLMLEPEFIYVQVPHCL